MRLQEYQRQQYGRTLVEVACLENALLSLRVQVVLIYGFKVPKKAPKVLKYWVLGPLGFCFQSEFWDSRGLGPEAEP